MSNKEIKEFINKLNEGLKLAEIRMLQEKSQRGEPVVIYTEENGIQRVSANHIIESYNMR